MVVVWGGKNNFGSDDLHRCGKIQPPHSHGAGKSSHRTATVYVNGAFFPNSHNLPVPWPFFANK
jgi:hypothetical protein